MKVSITTVPIEPTFYPITVQLVLESQDEVNAIRKFGWYTGTMRNALRRKRMIEGDASDRPLSDGEIEYVKYMMRRIRSQLRAEA